MVMLIIYVLIALGFSFLCSIAESVILSVTRPYVSLMEREGHRAGPLLRKLKDDINAPLAAILTLNTVAHTAGAAGAGAQAQAVFGNQYITLISAILTLLILIFSEIIPKTLGAVYWRQLAPPTAYVLRFLVWILYPFVKMSEWMTKGLAHGPTLTGFSREEFAVMAQLGEEEGQLEQRESSILRNLFFTLRDHSVREVMTPRTVVFSLSQEDTLGNAYEELEKSRFSRIPIYERQDPDCVVGFVLKADLMLAYARGATDERLSSFRRDMLMLPETATIYQAFQKMLARRVQISAVIDEYGRLEGLVTLEDLLETLLGEEIVDEADKTPDRQELAKRLWRWRSKRYGLKVHDESADTIADGGEESDPRTAEGTAQQEKPEKPDKPDKEG